MLAQVVITAVIIFTTHAGVIKNCGGVEIAGCFKPDTNTIYVARDVKKWSDYSADFTLYHELGHSFFYATYPKNIWKDGYLETADEAVADDFAWWIYGFKYPKERAFVNSVLTTEAKRYFIKTCDSGCVNQILRIKIK